MTSDEQNLARLVRERARRSKRSTKFSLNDEDEDGGQTTLTHKGKSISDMSARDHVILSDDDEDDIGNLDAADTALHFGGGCRSAVPDDGYYGPTAGAQGKDMSSMYMTRKMELDDLILRRKIKKAERMKSREDQTEAFEAMDESFAELSNMLSFRDKEKEIREHVKSKRAGMLAPEDQEMEDWDKQMKQYQFNERKVKATDRVKTPEEIAKEEVDRLHELETRRLARMNGDFVDDDLSDISDGERNLQKRKTRKSTLASTAEALDDSEVEDDAEEKVTTRFTADGLVEVDRNGVVAKKVNAPDNDALNGAFAKGSRVSACYHAKEQLDDDATWFNGVVSGVYARDDGLVVYNIEYDDGDFEDGVEHRHVRPADETKSVRKVEEIEANKQEQELELKRKRLRAKEKARAELPFVFEVPTTLEALHDMIGTYASTGADASLIIKRIHASNSVRLDRRNAEKMQNFYDVAIRRFVAVGDAIYRSGDGDSELGRFKQLDELARIMYTMAQDSAESATAVWGRRLGVFQNAHAKRLRDAELDRDEDDEDQSAWPSIGVFLALRAIGHIFPVTDQRHQIITPTLLMLGQIVSQTPVLSIYDLVVGTMCSALLIEYTKAAKRISPEAIAFIAGVLRMFASDSLKRQGPYSLPSLEKAVTGEQFDSFRALASSYQEVYPPNLSFERIGMFSAETPAALLYAALHLVEVTVLCLSGSGIDAERELFHTLAECVLNIKPYSKKHTLCKCLQEKAASAAECLEKACKLENARPPLRRRSLPTIRDTMIKSLAPRIENAEKYSMSKDKGKNAPQAALDRTRRELRREHKAVSRELRLDSSFVERARREEQTKKDSAAQAKRQKAYGWLENEQATMNQEVRMGGGLLKGGGMGAAKAKAATGKLGMKKGGKLKR